jgi:hypothetical protein
VTTSLIDPTDLDTDDARLLRIYINDHRAAASGGIALARRCERANRGTALGDELCRLIGELEWDAEELSGIARRLSVPDDPFKHAVARVGEVVGRIKQNGRLRDYSPLSRVLELELLLSGIDAKRSLWRSLRCSGPPLFDIDLMRLEERASEQRARLVPHHTEAARLAFDSVAPWQDDWVSGTMRFQ